MEDPKQYIEELEERVIDLKAEVVQLSAMLACAEVALIAYFLLGPDPAEA